jgi:coenzyme PQQ precursor peptide PqqA
MCRHAVMVSARLRQRIKKIMRLESCCKGCAAALASANLEPGISIPALAVRWVRHRQRRLFMVWQTPAATDIRFGFEITLYVAAR